MDRAQTLDVPSSDTRFTQKYYLYEAVGDDASIPESKFSQPIQIETWGEDSEFLEAEIEEKINETVKADRDWSSLTGTRSIDTSVVAGFMFQTDSGTGCSITVTENGNRPIRILIDREQEFAMVLVVVLRHEKWTTSGKFNLRFVRRVPISAKRCTARLDGPVAENSVRHVVTSSSSDTTSGEELASAADDSRGIEEGGELASATDDSRDIEEGGELASATHSSTAVEEGRELASDNDDSMDVEEGGELAFTNNNSMVPLSRYPELSEDGDTTDEEDWRAMGAAALREGAGSIIPPHWRQPTE